MPRTETVKTTKGKAKVLAKTSKTAKKDTKKAKKSREVKEEKEAQAAIVEANKRLAESERAAFNHLAAAKAKIESRRIERAKTERQAGLTWVNPAATFSPSTDSSNDEPTDDLFGPESSENGFNDSPISEEPNFGFDSSREYTQNSPEVFDIFTYAEKICTPAGDVARFRIHKNGEYITLKNWPYSWEKLQAEYGAGMYRVQAISGSRGTILKTSTQQIGEDPFNRLNKKEEASSASPQLDTLTLMNLLSQKEEKAESKARRDMERQMEQMKEMNALFLNMVTSKNNDQSSSTVAMQQMMIDMQKANFEMIKTLNDSMNNSVKELTKYVNEATNKKPEIDPFSLVKMLQEERNAGMAQAQQLMELVEAKVQAAKEDSDDEPQEKEGIGETLIKAFAPAIAGAMTQGMPAQQIPMQRPPQQRRAIPARGPQAANPGTNPAPQSAQPSQAGGEAPKRNLEASGAGPSTVVVNGLPRANLTVNENLDHKDSNAESKIIDAKPVTAQTDASDKIRDLALPIIADKLINQADPRAAALDTITELQKSGITAKIVVTDWSVEKLIATARSLGVPEIADPWFKEFFDEVENLAGSRGHRRENELTAP